MRVVALVAAAGLAAATASAASAPPRFEAEISPVRWSDIRFSYREGCPVGPADLRTVRLRHWDFGGRSRVGTLVVNRRVTGDIVRVFRRLYEARFPIRSIVPVSAFRGSDSASTAADNTSSFNCRRAVGSATGAWSMHAYGLAIDVNTVENPYVLRGRALPPSGARYLDRSDHRPGMAVEGGVLVRAFDAVGWGWGGRWSGSIDYQHFSTNGR